MPVPDFHLGSVKANGIFAASQKPHTGAGFTIPQPFAAFRDGFARLQNRGIVL